MGRRKKVEESGRVFGYCRCSTNEDKQNVNRQVADVISMGANKEYIYTEYGSGTKRDRVELNRMLDVIGEGDTLIVTELSRISRSMADLLGILDILKDKKVKVVLGSFVLDFRNSVDPMTIGLVQMMGVFSQMEREITVQRIKSGLDNAVKSGKVLGRKKVTLEDVPKKFMRYYKEYVSRSDTDTPMSIAELCRLAEVKSRTTAYKYIKMLGGEE